MKWLTLTAALMFVSVGTSNANADLLDMLDEMKAELFGGGGHGGDCCAPAPKCCAPAPKCCAPAPKCCAPKPVCCAPAPKCCAPAPKCCAPKPVCPETECCDPCCGKKHGLLDGLFRHNDDCCGNGCGGHGLLDGLFGHHDDDCCCGCDG